MKITEHSRKIVVFWDGSFPFVDAAPISRLALRRAAGDAEVVLATARQLPSALDSSCDLLVMPYGSAWPLSAWGAIRAYLERGGNWLNLGGAPLTRPAVRNVGRAYLPDTHADIGPGRRASMPDLHRWHLQCPQTAYGRELLILQSFQTPLPAGAELRSLRPELELGPLLGNLRLERAWALQFRFGREQQYKDEPGSTAEPEALCRPLVHAMAGGRTLAAPIVAVDRIAGPCAGGRWVFAACQGQEPLPEALIARLMDYATRPAVQLEVTSSLACYHKGERPSVRVRSLCRRKTALRVLLRVEHEGREVLARELSLVAGKEGASRPLTVTVPAKAPGLYSITATAWESDPLRPMGATAAPFAAVPPPSTAAKNAAVAPGPNARQETKNEPLAFTRAGFWVRDAKLLARPKPLTVNRDYFVRDGKPYPVSGSTYMCGQVHRHFLFDPRPAQWEEDFAAMKSAGVNMVRTGVWTGWKRIFRRGKVSEPVLRALEAWLLTAARHDMPVIFTFFAFTPPEFGGENCYIDPVALKAQEQYVRAFARRFAGAGHLMYDFINEPSFCCPRRLWSVRPNYDASDRRAWEAWSRQRCPDDAELSERWRRPGADPALRPPAGGAGQADRSLPELRDFEDRHTFEGHHPLAAGDYRLYGQEMFSRWTARMVRAVRQAGSRQLLTVGQDEGACADRPNPWFHGPHVDFTTNHSWWFNDDLLWDSVITKTPDRPNLIQETGIMFFERPDGGPARTLDDCRNLLERKMAFSLAGGCAGFIQWLWKTDPLMPVDNESAIGLHHVDGSEKPELEAFRRVARFLAQAGPHMIGRRAEEACVVLPHSLMYSVRNLATDATRQAVRAMEYRLGVPCRAVSEHRAGEAGHAKLILLPSPRMLSEECWRALLAKVRAGATLLVTGFVEADEYWRPAQRLQAWGLRTAPQMVAREERVSLPGGKVLEFTFAGEHQHRGEKAIGTTDLGTTGVPGTATGFAVAGSPVAETTDLRLPPRGGGVTSVIPGKQVAELSDIRILPHGRGKIIYCPVPAELAQSEDQTAALYRFAAAQAGIDCPSGRDPAVLIRPVEFERSTLYLLVNESGRAQKARLVAPTAGPGRVWERVVPVPAERIALLLLDRRTGAALASLA